MGKVRELHRPGQKAIFRDQLVTLGDLEDFKADLLLSIKHLFSGSKAEQSAKKWLKSYQVKTLLNISNGTLQNLRNNGTLPHTKIGGIIYYNSESIDKMLLEKQRQLFPGQQPKMKNY